MRRRRTRASRTSRPSNERRSSGPCAPRSSWVALGWTYELLSDRRSWDVDLVDDRCRGALRDVIGQKPERFLGGCRLDGPPDGVPAGAARSERRPMAKRAFVPFERGEDDAA